jgi:hypothetical protein
MSERMAFMCEWRDGRVRFHSRRLKDSEPFPEHWHTTEEQARESVARHIREMAYGMLRTADEVTRDRRGD